MPVVIFTIQAAYMYIALLQNLHTFCTYIRAIGTLAAIRRSTCAAHIHLCKAEIFLLLYFLGQPYINLFFTVGIIPQKIQHFLSLFYCFILFCCSCIVAIFKVIEQLVAPL